MKLIAPKILVLIVIDRHAKQNTEKNMNQHRLDFSRSVTLFAWSGLAGSLSFPMGKAAMLYIGQESALGLEPMDVRIEFCNLHPREDPL